MLKGKLMNDMLKMGIMTAIIAVAMPEMASAAADDVSQLIHNVAANQLPALPYILGAVCYVAGSFMLVSGALHLRNHAENPAQAKLAPGVARLLTGGAITAVPSLVGIIQRTSEVAGSAEGSFNQFNVSF